MAESEKRAREEEHPLPRPTVPSEDYAYAQVIELRRIAAAMEYMTNALKGIEHLLRSGAPEPEPKQKPKRG